MRLAVRRASCWFTRTEGLDRKQGKRMSGKRSPRGSARTPAMTPLIELARTQLHDGKFADAQATARRAVGLSPKNTEAHLLLAEAQQRAGRPHEAVATL